MPILAAMFIVLFTLKLGVANTVVETWSWWYITAPLWAPALVSLFLWLVGVVGILIFGIKR